MSADMAFVAPGLSGQTLQRADRLLPAGAVPSAPLLSSHAGGSKGSLLPLSLCVAAIAGVQRTVSLRTKARIGRKSMSSSKSGTSTCGRKTQCLHPDKPAMFACADCPRRNSKAAMEDGSDQPMAVAAFVGEEVASNVCSRKTQCLHPDKPAMFACADCPRRNSKAAMEDGSGQPMAVAAFVGEEVASNVCSRKTQCLHPDKPAMFACADCPRRNSKAAMEDGSGQPMAVAAFVGEEVASNVCNRKTQCLHPDKPAMFACADCPRRSS